MSAPRHRWASQPQSYLPIDWGNPLTQGLGFNTATYDGRNRVFPELLVRSSTFTIEQTRLGRGWRSAANSAFLSTPGISETNTITVAFIVRQIGSTGTQILFEHTANQNSNPGSCVAYFDSGNLETGVSNGAGLFNVVRCAAPALGRTTKIVIRLTRSGTTAKAGRVWYDGVEQTTTQIVSNSVGGNFAISTTYWLGRGGSSLFANATIHDCSIWRRGLTDNEVIAWNTNPWQLYLPAEREGVFSAGGGVNYDVALIETTSALETVSAVTTITYAGVLAETATASETGSARASYLGSVAETSTASETVSSIGALFAALSETAVGSDTVAGGAAFLAALAETIVASETVSSVAAAGGVLAFVSESTTASETASVIAALNVVIDEVVQARDSLTTLASMFITVTEALQALDTPRTSTPFTADVQESVRATLVLMATGLWNAINDSQDPNWQNVVDTQGPGWTDINP